MFRWSDACFQMASETSFPRTGGEDYPAGNGNLAGNGDPAGGHARRTGGSLRRTTISTDASRPGCGRVRAARHLRL